MTPSKPWRELRDEKANEAHLKWLMFLNADPDDTGCSQAPSDVFLNAFKDGYDSALAEAQKEIAELKAERDSLCESFDEMQKLAQESFSNGRKENAYQEDLLTTELNQAKAELEAHRIYRRKWLASEKQVAELKGALENEQEYLRVLNEGCLKALKNDLWTLMADERINSIENTLKKLTPPDRKE